MNAHGIDSRIQNHKVAISTPLIYHLTWWELRSTLSLTQRTGWVNTCVEAVNVCTSSSTGDLSPPIDSSFSPMDSSPSFANPWLWMAGCLPWEISPFARWRDRVPEPAPNDGYHSRTKWMPKNNFFLKCEEGLETEERHRTGLLSTWRPSTFLHLLSPSPGNVERSCSLAHSLGRGCVV